MGETDHLLRSIEQKKDRLDTLRPLAGQALHRLEAWYDMEWTYTSNALEGNSLTHSETAIVIEKGITVRGKALKDHEEAIDHFEAIRFVRGLVQDARPVTEADMRDIHRLVMARTGHGEAGQYATFERRIAGSRVKLAGPEQIPALMGDLGHWLSRTEPTPHTAIEAHLRLVTIHPFTDSNGRTARLVMNLQLMRGGYPPVIIPPAQRPDYIDSLEKAQLTGDKGDFEALLLNRLDDSLDQYLTLLDDHSPASGPQP